MTKTDFAEPEEAVPFPWSPGVRVLASILLAGFLGLVLLGPLSNPIASENLTYPMARVVRPIHRGLFLGHGYRFFGPDPGPSHIIQYKIQTQQESTIQGQIPDRNRHWPRVIYHRWFMLSETLFELYSSTNSSQEQLKEIEKQLETLRQHPGNQRQVARLELVRQSIVAQNVGGQKAFENILQRIAESLLDQHDGSSIELKIQERLIPFPDEVRRGAKLSDDRFLEEIKTFRFDAEKLELETLPLEPASTSAGGRP